MAPIRTIRGIECRYSHTSRKKGYVSRVTPNPEHPTSKGYYEPYSGRFGEGFAELEPSYNSTRYCYISYWIKEELNHDESRSGLK